MNDASPERPALVTDYELQRPLYAAFAATVAGLLTQLAEVHSLAIQSVSHRAKEPDSLRGKLSLRGPKYNALSDITDLAGIRVITYFAEDVDQLAKAIEGEFDIDRAHSVDKRAIHDPDRFGYLSLHYVIRLAPPRDTLPEYRRFSGLRAEVQLRSLLQHAWAEIEHDLGYKSKNAVPGSARRRFARLAGLLELVDSEFCSLRNELADHQRQVSAKSGDAAFSGPIDKDSLAQFVAAHPLVRSLDLESAALGGQPPTLSPLVAPSLVVDELAWVGFTSLEDVASALEKHAAIIRRFTALWLTEPEDGGSVPAGVSLFYLCYVLVAEPRDLARIAAYLRENNIGGDGEDVAVIAVDVLNTYVASLQAG